MIFLDIQFVTTYFPIEFNDMIKVKPERPTTTAHLQASSQTEMEASQARIINYYFCTILSWMTTI
jgi:hypothetical protein